MDKLRELKADFYDAMAQRDFWQQQMNTLNQKIVAELQKTSENAPEELEPGTDMLP